MESQIKIIAHLITQNLPKIFKIKDGIISRFKYDIENVDCSIEYFNKDFTLNLYSLKMENNLISIEIRYGKNLGPNKKIRSYDLNNETEYLEFISLISNLEQDVLDKFRYLIFNLLDDRIFGTCNKLNKHISFNRYVDNTEKEFIYLAIANPIVDVFIHNSHSIINSVGRTFTIHHNLSDIHLILERFIDKFNEIAREQLYYNIS